MTTEMNTNYLKLTPNETHVKSWRIESTYFENSQILCAMLTCGLYLIYNSFFNEKKRFYSLHLTSERVLVTEEYYEMKKCVTLRIMENMASYKIEDLCYLSSQEVCLICDELCF